MLHNLYLTVLVTTAMLLSGVAAAQPPRNPPPSRPPAGGPAATDKGFLSTGRPSMSGPAKYVAIPGLFPLSMSGVQREIALTPDQRQQLKAVSDGYMATVQRLGKTFDQLDPAEKPKQGKGFADQAAQAAQAAQRKAEAILNPEQLQTVKKIAFELSATGAGRSEHAEIDRAERRAAAALGRRLRKGGGKDAAASARNVPAGNAGLGRRAGGRTAAANGSAEKATVGASLRRPTSIRRSAS